jgi:hypothetical protein
LVVTAGQGTLFPATPFDATIWPAGAQPLSTNAEIVRVTAVTTDTFTITRAQYGTTAQTITTGYQIAQTIDANLLNQLLPLSGGTMSGTLAMGGNLITGGVFTSPFETASISATALSGSVAAALNASSSTFYLYTGTPTAGYTVNITNAPTITGQSVTFAILVNNGATAYLPLNVTINGVQAGTSSTVLPAQGATNNGIQTWYQGGTAWTAANASNYDSYTFTVISTGTSTWVLLLNQTKF